MHNRVIEPDFDNAVGVSTLSVGSAGVDGAPFDRIATPDPTPGVA